MYYDPYDVYECIICLSPTPNPSHRCDQCTSSNSVYEYIRNILSSTMHWTLNICSLRENGYSANKKKAA
jgi:hypothetical protein